MTTLNIQKYISLLEWSEICTAAAKQLDKTTIERIWKEAHAYTGDKPFDQAYAELLMEAATDKARLENDLSLATLDTSEDPDTDGVGE